MLRRLFSQAYTKAFAAGAVAISLSAAVQTEYRTADPFGTYSKQRRPMDFMLNVAQTALVSFTATLSLLLLFWILLGLGRKLPFPGR